MLEPHDLAIAKYAAAREKDLIFAHELARHGIVFEERLLSLLDQTPSVVSTMYARLDGRIPSHPNDTSLLYVCSSPMSGARRPTPAGPARIPCQTDPASARAAADSSPRELRQVAASGSRRASQPQRRAAADER